MRGEHSAAHIAALVRYLPSDCASRIARDPDAAWTLESTLLACILNSLNGLIYGMSDKKKRGNKPQPIGPSYIAPKKKLDAKAMTSEELMEILSRPRS